MKKSLLALLFAVALAVPALAENMWIGGSFGYSSTNVEKWENTDSATNWEIAPEFGVSLDDKWDIGLDLSYSSGYQTGVFGVDYANAAGIPISVAADTKTMGIAPFVRYHVAKIAGVDVMFKASAFYAKADIKTKEFIGKDIDANAYGINIAPVISYSINETWSIGATLNFAALSFIHAESDDDDIDVKADQFGFNLNDGSLINIGFSYHF
jgi:long-subunit fatty acid transport protein